MSPLLYFPGWMWLLTAWTSGWQPCPQGRVKLEDLWDPFQAWPFYDSMIFRHVFQAKMLAEKWCNGHRSINLWLLHHVCALLMETNKDFLHQLHISDSWLQSHLENHSWLMATACFIIVRTPIYQSWGHHLWMVLFISFLQYRIRQVIL